MSRMTSATNFESNWIQYLAQLAMCLLLIGLSGCERKGPESLVLELAKSNGDLVKVRGPARTVQSLQSRVASLRSWAEDAKKWYERYKDSRANLESATADKCVRDIKQSCGDILTICKAIRQSSDLMAVSSANLLVDDYEAFANNLLAAVRSK